MTPTIPQQNINAVLDHILPRINHHIQSQKSKDQKTPFILGLTGLQGSGKSTWTDALVQTLRQQHEYNTIAISLDDLYLDHDELIALRDSNASNNLLRTRGQPGTHDTRLAVDFLQSVADPTVETLIPSFDKSKFNGEGGRAARETWKCIPAGTIVDVVVFEGWCVGFQPLRDEEILSRWNSASISQSSAVYSVETLRDHALEHLLAVNRNLARYCELFMSPSHFDFLVHLDTDDLVNVYEWRIQQEHALRRKGNGGMSDDEVVRFVRGYMPAYELYLDQLRDGLFRAGLSQSRAEQKGQLRVVLDKERNIVGVDIL